MAACGDSVRFAFWVLSYLWDIYSPPNSEEIKLSFSSRIYIYILYVDIWTDSRKKQKLFFTSIGTCNTFNMRNFTFTFVMSVLMKSKLFLILVVGVITPHNLLKIHIKTHKLHVIKIVATATHSLSGGLISSPNTEGSIRIQPVLGCFASGMLWSTAQARSSVHKLHFYKNGTTWGNLLYISGDFYMATINQWKTAPPINGGLVSFSGRKD